MLKNLPLTLTVILYLLIYLVRFQQGGYDPKIDLFQTQRKVLDQKLGQFLPTTDAALVSGILLGQNKDLPYDLKLALRDTSTLHIVVASGQNLSIMGGFFLCLSGLIKRRNAVLISILAVIFYTLLTGVQVPILRAAIMFIFSSLAALVGREKESWKILFITAGGMLLVNPSWLTSISFQLSFLATFGVIVVAPILLKWLNRIPIIGQDLAVSLAAQLMVTPVIAQNFHQFSLVGLITNVLVLWTVFFIMIGGAILLIIGVIWEIGGIGVGIALSALTQYFIYVVTFFGSLPFAWEYIGEMSIAVWLGYYFLLGGVLKWIYGQKETGTESSKSS